MTRRTYLGGIAAVCATILVSAGLLAQEKPQGEGEMSPMEQAWMAYMTPGKAHDQLAQRAGDWTYTGKFHEYPGAEPQIFEGKAHAVMIMDGRYLIEKVEGPFMGMTFKGMGIFGYDNMLQKFTGAWIDNMGTGVLQYEAPASKDSTINWTGQQPDLMEGVYKTIRTVDDMPDADHKVMVTYAAGPDGKEFKHMILAYTRSE